MSLPDLTAAQTTPLPGKRRAGQRRGLGSAEGTVSLRIQEFSGWAERHAEGVSRLVAARWRCGVQIPDAPRRHRAIMVTTCVTASSRPRAGRDGVRRGQPALHRLTRVPVCGGEVPEVPPQSRGRTPARPPLGGEARCTRSGSVAASGMKPVVITYSPGAGLSRMLGKDLRT